MKDFINAPAEPTKSPAISVNQQGLKDLSAAEIQGVSGGNFALFLGLYGAYKFGESIGKAIDDEFIKPRWGN